MWGGVPGRNHLIRAKSVPSTARWFLSHTLTHQRRNQPAECWDSAAKISHTVGVPLAWMKAAVLLAKPLTWNREWLWNSVGIQVEACSLLPAAPGQSTGAHAGLCGTWWQTQSRLHERELQKLHSRPKSTRCKGGNWLDSTCNRDGKTLSPEGPHRSSRRGGEQRGFGCWEISLEGGSGSLTCQFHPRQTRELDPHRETYSWCVSVALVLLGTVSDSPPLNWSGELQSREFSKRTVKTQQHNGQWVWLWFGLWGDHGKPDGNLARLPWAREVRAYADTASWAGARGSPGRKQRLRVCSAVLPCSFCL